MESHGIFKWNLKFNGYGPTDLCREYIEQELSGEPTYEKLKERIPRYPFRSPI